MTAEQPELLTTFQNALDCCGTCAGGVLASHVRAAKADAWDEGYRRGTLDATSDAEPTPGATRLLAAEHLLSQHLPHMRSMDRLRLVIEIRDLLDGTTAVGQEVA